MKRQSIKKPGYDCIRNPCGKNGCGTHAGSNHGIHCDDWIYVVKADEGDAALSVTIFSGIFPDSVPEEHRVEPARYPWGVDITIHTSFPLDVDDIKRADAGLACEFLKGGRCFTTGYSISYAEQLVKDAFFKTDGFEQPEGWWLELESIFAKRLPELRAERVDTTHERCPRCDGVGTVRK